MKTFLKLGYAPALALALLVAPIAQAATTPSLGAAASYGVLGSTYTNTAAGTTINGDVGFTTGPAVAPLGTHVNYGSGAPYAQAGTDQGAALSNLAGQACTFTFGAGPINLSTDITHGPIGVYTPGVYCSSGAMDVGGPLTLSGSGTFIFRSGGALTSTAGAVVSLTAGASACDVFWTPAAATTLAANTTFFGTVISNAGVTVGANTVWTGRSLAFGGTVTTDTNTITVPVCTIPPGTTFSSNAPAPLIHVTKIPSPLALPNGPGPVTYTYQVTNPGPVTLTGVTLSDDKCLNALYVSGDANGNSWLENNETWTYTCNTTLSATTVNYATAQGFGNGLGSVDTAIAQVIVGVAVVPPLIHVVKTPSPLNLPFNGGSVTYSYAVTNPGTVPLTGVTLTDDKCSNVTFVSGDSNGNFQLNTNETWMYTCVMQVNQTLTNTALATGHANGLTAVDTALATVIVAGSPLPPLIHIIKQADPVILPAEGGMVTYTYVVTNPGTVALNTVTVTDDKCGAMTPISGDANGNSLMDTNETWVYTCQQNLTVSTTNVATAQGSANGITVTDLSVASVVLSPALAVVAPQSQQVQPAPIIVPSAPTLPNTGTGPSNGSNLLVAAAALFVAGTLLFALSRRKRLS